MLCYNHKQNYMHGGTIMLGLTFPAHHSSAHLSSSLAVPILLFQPCCSSLAVPTSLQFTHPFLPCLHFRDKILTTEMARSAMGAGPRMWHGNALRTHPAPKLLSYVAVQTPNNPYLCVFNSHKILSVPRTSSPDINAPDACLVRNKPLLLLPCPQKKSS